MKINDKSFPNEGKLSIQFPKLEKKNLVLFDHQLLKINRILGIEKKKSEEICSFIISSKVSIPTSGILEKKLVSIIFNVKTFTHFRAKLLQILT